MTVERSGGFLSGRGITPSAGASWPPAPSRDGRAHPWGSPPPGGSPPPPPPSSSVPSFGRGAGSPPPAFPLFAPTAAHGHYGSTRAAGTAPAVYQEEPGFVGFLARGAVLKLVTFGLYRFWYITEMRRRLWQATGIGDDRLEYLGTGRELVIGFLFALAIVVPLNILLFAGSIGLGRVHWSLSFASAVALWFFGNFAVYRARRYRLTRTVFRGVRFWMDGSATWYTVQAFLWSLLTVATAGLALPWQVAALERYKMRHSHWGDLKGDFVSTGWDLFKRGIWLWLIGAVAVLLVVGALVERRNTNVLNALAFIPLLILGAFLLLPVYFAIFRRWLISGVRFGPIGFTCAIGAGRFYAHYVKLAFASWGWSIVFGAVAAIAAVAVAALLGIDTRSDLWLRRFDPTVLRRATPEMIALGVMAVAGYMLFLQGFSALKVYFITRGLWEATVEATTVTGTEALDRVRQVGQGSSAIGEGLADALDVGGL